MQDAIHWAALRGAAARGFRLQAEGSASWMCLWLPPSGGSDARGASESVPVASAFRRKEREGIGSAPWLPPSGGSQREGVGKCAEGIIRLPQPTISPSRLCHRRTEATDDCTAESRVCRGAASADPCSSWRRAAVMAIKSVGVAVLGAVIVAATVSTAGAQTTEAGRKVFESRCARCHGGDGNGGEMGPPILERLPARDAAQLTTLIHEGIPLKGMPPSDLSDAGVNGSRRVPAIDRAAARDCTRGSGPGADDGREDAGRAAHGGGVRRSAGDDGRQTTSPAAPHRRSGPRGVVRGRLARVQRRTRGQSLHEVDADRQEHRRAPCAAMDVQHSRRRPVADHASCCRRRDVCGESERVLRARCRKRAGRSGSIGGLVRRVRRAATRTAGSRSPAIGSSWRPTTRT